MKSNHLDFANVQIPLKTPITVPRLGIDGNATLTIDMGRNTTDLPDFSQGRDMPVLAEET
jgi:hypothetical protein